MVNGVTNKNGFTSLTKTVKEQPTITEITFSLPCRQPIGVNPKRLNIGVLNGQEYATKSLKKNNLKIELITAVSLDPDDRHYIKRKADLDDRLYRMYDKIEDTENLLIAARAKKTAIEAEKLTADNIYKVLIYFDKLYAVMDEYERRKFMESLVSEVHVYEERKPNGQWLKSIKFKLPIIEEDMELCLDNGTHVETVCLLSKQTV